MLSEVFVRFTRTLTIEDVKKLVKENKKVYVEKIRRYNYVENAVTEETGVLMIHECGLIKCECTEDSCYCGFAIVTDLLNQVCFDRFEKYIVSVIDRMNITNRVRPM
jgi:hypothetical protein